MRSIRERIEGEVSGWPGVEARPHRFSGVEFRVRGHEIGHPHGDSLANLPFPKKVREELVSEGRAQPHHVLPETSWTSYRIRGPEDVEGVLELFRLNYERLVKRVGAVIDGGRSAPVEETVGFALAKACRAHRVNVGAALSGIELHVGQEMVLLELWKEVGLKGSKLAARLRVEPPTVTRMLQRLEDCGLVERRKNMGDARSFRVCLTEKGRALERPVRERWGQVEEGAFRGMSEERALLRAQLARIRENLDAV